MLRNHTSSSLPTRSSTSHTWKWRDAITHPTSVGKTTPATLSSSQSRAILIAALSCACVSLVLVLITLRWFLMMRRYFRHRLVLHLIASDTFKAIWYFVFPVVVFAGGPVGSTSNFCQASGFLLAFAIEASDMAILIIALHSTLCILRSDSTIGEGGLDRYSSWIYPLWLGPPLLAASFAFINNYEGYTLAGTFCYLPKRPFWYRLALSWVPRYLIISLILIMYVWIYIYDYVVDTTFEGLVHVKFRGFENLGATDDSFDAEVRRRSGLSMKSNDVERRGTNRSSGALPPSILSPSYRQTQNQILDIGTNLTTPQLQPWDHMQFITSKPLEVPIAEMVDESEAGNMMARGSGWSGETHVPPTDRPGQPIPARETESKREADSQKPAGRPAIYGGLNVTPDDQRMQSVNASARLDDPLRKTRMAIRKQLRYLFIYPLVYIIMWSFPFASHTLNYNDYYVQHPVFWLSLVQTIMLSLQAGVDSIMFSCSEKPWRRVDASSKFSLPFLRRQSRAFLQRCSLEKSPVSSSDYAARQQPATNHNPTWWEAEGRRRHDSIWLGTNTISYTLSSLTARTRSRSPHKQGQDLQAQRGSCEQGPVILPQLPPISAGTGTLPLNRNAP
ncbi:plasma membrane G-protein coupled receptor [Cladophialophora carrionii]|uniref:Plasma membrane G-protein coupled receptor n=1 Tax=Cladophialophora carrionii TaxID=86049 RepID=A0A1C1C7M3_9EURO|nr:plasma membrane G-protein coupled receptor [Cladophialophora carrionii]